MNNKIPSIAVVSCSSSKQPISIIEVFTEHMNLNESVKENVTIYSWNIDTKYYTAKVDLCPIQLNSVQSDELYENVEAIIIYFDSSKDSGLEDVKMWNYILDDCEPDVKLLISDICNTDTTVTKAKAVEWCVKNGFELIELSPVMVKEESPNDDEIIKETHGVERIIEALQTHLWSNLIMKTKDQQESEEKSSSMDGILNNLLLDDEQAEFSELFQQLSMMKESVQSMPSRERKQCAEQVVSAFWRAIGGDEDEIADK